VNKASIVFVWKGGWVQRGMRLRAEPINNCLYIRVICINATPVDRPLLSYERRTS